MDEVLDHYAHELDKLTPFPPSRSPRQLTTATALVWNHAWCAADA